MPLKLPAKFRRLLPWFEAHRRTAWKPVVKAGRGAPAASRIGGLPWLAEGEAWPTCGRCKGPMRFFAQINLDDLPKAAQGRYGPGLLQAFFCIVDDCIHGQEGAEPFSKCRLLRIVDADGPGADVEPPSFDDRNYEDAEPHDKPFKSKSITGWTEVDDYPALAEMEALGLKFDDADDAVICNRPKFKAEATIEEYCKLGRCVDGEKLAGWPGWANITVDYPKCPRCRTLMDRVIFQIGSDDNLPFMFGDDGQGHIVQCPKHPRTLAFPWTCG
jgi:uncharacterized protein YwqG